MIKAVIFDNNGVITTSDAEGTLQEVSSYLGTTSEKLKPVWEEVAKDVDEGKISTLEFYDKVLKALNLKADLEGLRKIHLGSYVIKPEVKSYVSDLAKKIEVALSNSFGFLINPYLCVNMPCFKAHIFSRKVVNNIIKISAFQTSITVASLN